MDEFVIQGGQAIRGSIAISGAKNAALPIMAACLLTAETMTLGRIPALRDVNTMCELLTQMGVVIHRDEPHSIEITAQALHSVEAPYDLVRTMRASILVLGPLLARFGEARVSLPGGCAIGARPVGFHIDGIRAMGAEVTVEDGYIVAHCAGRLQGCTLTLETISVTGTENLMMAATLAAGTTVLKNAAQEPEVIDLAQCLNSMGAKVSGAGTSTITIEGVAALHGGQYDTIPDRIEAGTYLAAAAASRGEIELTQIIPEHLTATLDRLQHTGAEITVETDRICLNTRGKRPKAFNIRTAPYPALPTDMQAQLLAVNTVAEGSASITETVFENRFMHVNELIRMGADIRIEGHTALVNGVPQLKGATVMATDLRASASLVIAALVAEGETRIKRVYHMDRGYENIEANFARLGAHIERVSGM